VIAVIRPLLSVVLAGVLLAPTGCTGSAPAAKPTPPAPSSAAPSSAAPSSAAPTAPPPTAEPQPRPKIGACYDLDYDQALSPASHQRPVACGSEHTSLTYFVTTLPEVEAGHLLAVDSDRVQEAVARTCRARFAAYVGGTTVQRRLSLLRPIWFTPTLRAADRGADWMRCDVVALSGQAELARLTSSPKGSPEAYALCGTAQPGTKDFSRVLCRDDHSWRAVSTVDLPGADYPGEQAAKTRAAGPCKQQGADHADDPLNYQWGSEVPTRDQWEAGTTWATCWVPD
jgi:hypothetical protein